MYAWIESCLKFTTHECLFKACFCFCFVGCIQGVTSEEAVQEDLMVGRSVGEGNYEVETQEKIVYRTPSERS